MSYQPYEPLGAHEPRETVDVTDFGGGPWQVAVEYSNKGQAKPPTIVQIGRTEFADRKTALRAAKRTAFEHDPPDPWAQQGRSVWRDGADGFLVVLQGATSTFHMSVRVVQRLREDSDGTPPRGDGAVL